MGIVTDSLFTTTTLGTTANNYLILRQPPPLPPPSNSGAPPVYRQSRRSALFDPFSPPPLAIPVCLPPASHHIRLGTTSTSAPRTKDQIQLARVASTLLRPCRRPRRLGHSSLFKANEANPSLPSQDIKSRPATRSSTHPLLNVASASQVPIRFTIVLKFEVKHGDHRRRLRARRTLGRHKKVLS